MLQCVPPDTHIKQDASNFRDNSFHDAGCSWLKEKTSSMFASSGFTSHPRDLQDVSSSYAHLDDSASLCLSSGPGSLWGSWGIQRCWKPADQAHGFCKWPRSGDISAYLSVVRGSLSLYGHDGSPYPPAIHMKSQVGETPPSPGIKLLNMLSFPPIL
jgi:hypothetical protein